MCLNNRLFQPASLSRSLISSDLRCRKSITLHCIVLYCITDRMHTLCDARNAEIRFSLDHLQDSGDIRSNPTFAPENWQTLYAAVPRTCCVLCCHLTYWHHDVGLFSFETHHEVNLAVDVIDRRMYYVRDVFNQLRDVDYRPTTSCLEISLNHTEIAHFKQYSNASPRQYSKCAGHGWGLVRSGSNLTIEFYVFFVSRTRHFILFHRPTDDDRLACCRCR